MSNLFDVASGEIHIGNHVTLRAGATPQELALAGLVFVRELNMKTGWIFKVTNSVVLAGHVVQFSLGFQDDVLKRASFGFTENPALDMSALFAEHNVFLRQQLGNPNSQNDRQSLYQYVWGEIASVWDPRGGGSSICVGWRL